MSQGQGRRLKGFQDWVVMQGESTGNRVNDLLRDGQGAACTGKKVQARQKFRAVLMLDPTNVSALLWLAWLSDAPRASLAYVARALACDPDNPRAHAALRWARRRATAPVPQTSLPIALSTTSASHRRSQRTIAAALGVLIVLIGVTCAWVLPDHLAALAAMAPTPSQTAAAITTPTSTSPPTHTPSPTPSPTSSPTPAPTHTPPPTAMPTRTPAPSTTPHSALPTAPPLPPTATLAPLSVPGNVRWIDVDLTHQRLNAYEGQTLVRTTLVSTGLARTPTPAGRYKIQIKLRSDDMDGPGYYLPNVPFTMYFYRGYALHGTYWHNNFGQPMSHGCVNLPTSEAEWLFNWAEVGTLVHIHY
jgi:lipoprotein-anchoring transpeptidase ErfK/SrfK